jgi:hypothetical protein
LSIFYLRHQRIIPSSAVQPRASAHTVRGAVLCGVGAAALGLVRDEEIYYFLRILADFSWRNENLVLRGVWGEI